MRLKLYQNLIVLKISIACLKFLLGFCVFSDLCYYHLQFKKTNFCKATTNLHLQIINNICLSGLILCFTILD